MRSENEREKRERWEAGMPEMLGATERFRSGDMRVVAAAVRVGEKVWSLVPPARHDAVMRHVYEETKAAVTFSTSEQGFVTDCGRFLSRKQAEVVARRSGQLEGDMIGSVLTSEDLW